jgi:hypothetical protein
MMAQVAIALLLVAGAGLMYRTVDRLLATNPGFDSHGVVIAGVALVGPRWAKNEAVLAFHDDVLRRLDAVPGIERAAFAAQIPLSGNYDRRGFHVEGRVENNADAPSAEFYPVSIDYFQVMRVPLRRGRLLTDADAAGKAPVVVIGETAAAQIFPGEDPIGRRVSIGADKGPYWTIGCASSATCGTTGLMSRRIRRRTSASGSSRTVVSGGAIDDRLRADGGGDPSRGRGACRGCADLEPRHARRQRADVDRVPPVSDVAPRGFAATALLLAAVGLYGVVSQGVASRRANWRANGIGRLVARRVRLGAQAWAAARGYWRRDGPRRVGVARALAELAALRDGAARSDHARGGRRRVGARGDRRARRAGAARDSRRSEHHAAQRLRRRATQARGENTTRRPSIRQPPSAPAEWLRDELVFGDEDARPERVLVSSSCTGTRLA